MGSASQPKAARSSPALPALPRPLDPPSNPSRHNGDGQKLGHLSLAACGRCRLATFLLLHLFQQALPRLSLSIGRDAPIHLPSTREGLSPGEQCGSSPTLKNAFVSADRFVGRLGTSVNRSIVDILPRLAFRSTVVVFCFASRRSIGSL